MSISSSSEKWFPSIRSARAHEIRTLEAHYFYDRAFHGEGDYVILQWTHSGCGEFVSGATYPLNPGDLFVVVPHREFQYYYPSGQTKPWVFSWLHLEGQAIARLWGEVVDDYGPVLRLTPGGLAEKLFLSLIRQWEGLPWHTPAEEEATELSRLLFTVVREVRERSHPRLSVCQGIARMMREDPGRSMVMKEWAQSVGLSREHLSRLFQQELGESPAAFQRRHRLRRAAQLLVRTKLPIKEIAATVGFAELRSFQRAFHKHYQRSPQSYRQDPKP